MSRMMEHWIAVDCDGIMLDGASTESASSVVLWETMPGYLRKAPDVGVVPWGTAGLVFSSYRAAESAYVSLSDRGLRVSQPEPYPSELPPWVASPLRAPFLSPMPDFDSEDCAREVVKSIADVADVFLKIGERFPAIRAGAGLLRRLISMAQVRQEHSCSS